MCTSKANYDEARKLLRAKDEAGLARMERAGKLFIAERGEEAKLIEKDFFSFRIRMTSGTNSGSDGWLPYEFVRKK